MSAPGATLDEHDTSLLTYQSRRWSCGPGSEEENMAENLYKVIELIGTSTESWERATSAAIERAAETLRDLRVAEVVQQDVNITDGKVDSFRVKLRLSFKYEAAD